MNEQQYTLIADGYKMCHNCGNLVIDTVIHDDWHYRLYTALQSAYHGTGQYRDIE